MRSPVPGIVPRDDDGAPLPGVVLRAHAATLAEADGEIARAVADIRATLVEAAAAVTDPPLRARLETANQHLAAVGTFVHGVLEEDRAANLREAERNSDRGQ